MTQKRSLLRAAVVLLAVLLLSVFASAAAETAEAPQQTVFVFDQDREMDLWQQDKTLRVFCIPVGAQDCYFITCESHAMVLDCAGVGREPTPDFLFRLCDALGIDRLDFVSTPILTGIISTALRSCLPKFRRTNTFPPFRWIRTNTSAS